MAQPVAANEKNAAMAELIELAGVTPRTTVPEMADELPLLDAAALAAAIGGADAVVSL